MNAQRSVILMGVFTLTFFMGGLVKAEPLLQLYVEGGVYESDTESWVLTPQGDSAGAPIRIWAIGDTSQGDIYDVQLAIAYDAGYRTLDDSGNILNDLEFNLAGSTTGGLGGFTDPSEATSVGPEYYQLGEEGTIPKLTDGSDLPTHGVYGMGTVWQSFMLGDMTLDDSPIADFVDTFPTPTSKMGQINVYELSRVFQDDSSADGVPLHFDLYNHVLGAPSAKVAPFSHDAETDIPEPSAIVGLLSMACLGMAIATFRRRRSRA